MEGKIAVLGDTNFVTPFSALGLDTFATGQTAEQIIDDAGKIVEGKYTLVIVAEDKAEQVQEIFSAYQNMPTPCILVVPFTTESTGLATKTLGKALRIATGIDIFHSD